MIVIEGVVGVGKTTLMELLIEKGYFPFEEPVEENPILDKFYYNRERFAFPLQVFFLNKRFEHLKKSEKIMKSVVMDRSIYGDAIFAKMLNKKEEMSNEEYSIYYELLENMLEHVKPPKLLIYLEISTEEAVKRIKQRGRKYELDTELKYWSDLNEEYRNYFDDYTLSPILKINVDNIDFKYNINDRNLIMRMIDDKLEELNNHDG